VYEQKFTYTSATHTSTAAYAGNVGKRKTHGIFKSGELIETSAISFLEHTAKDE